MRAGRGPTAVRSSRGPRVTIRTRWRPTPRTRSTATIRKTRGVAEPVISVAPPTSSPTRLVSYCYVSTNNYFLTVIFFFYLLLSFIYVRIYLFERNRNILFVLQNLAAASSPPVTSLHIFVEI